MPIPVPVQLDQPQAGSGLLAQSRPLPEGWQRGISFSDTSCLAPFTVGECPTGDDLKEPQRPESVTFRPVELGLAVQCSTLGNETDWSTVAGAELTRVQDHALASELYLGTASARDAGPSSDPNPSLVNSAVELTQAGGMAYLACLEKAILETNSGRGAVLFAPVEVGWALMQNYLIWRDGGRWRTVMGSLVIISEAFDGRAPDSEEPPAPNDSLFVYGTTAVWAGIGERHTLQDVDRSINDVTARAEDVAMAAFSPCATFAIQSPMSACPVIA